MYAKRTTVYATTEEMNLGTRYGSCSAASAFWLTQRYGDAVPFVLYSMPDVQSGWDALAELPFMETADDTGELMTDRLAQYGSYEYGRGGERICEAFIAANDISAEEFVDIAEIFAAHGGVLKEEKLPDGNNTVTDGETVSPVKPKKNRNVNGAVYEIYSAENRASALAYLRGRSVSTGMYYVIVETPEGSFGRDRCGCFSA